MSACWEQQMTSLVEQQRNILDACKEYRSQLDEANRRIDELQSRLSAAEAARDDYERKFVAKRNELDFAQKCWDKCLQERDELRDQLTCTQNARDYAKRENADLFARQSALISKVESLRKQRNEAETERAFFKHLVDTAHEELDKHEPDGGVGHSVRPELQNRIALLVARSHRNIRDLREQIAQTADALPRVEVKPALSWKNDWQDPLVYGPPYRTELEVQLPDGSIRRAKRASYGAVWKWLDCTHPLQCEVRPFDSTHWRYPGQPVVPPSQPLD